MMRTLLNKPKTERGRKTLSSILKAAEQVFYEKGYLETNITDITSRAGIGTGTFYEYFSGKLELYKYLIEYCGNQLMESIKVPDDNEKLTYREIEKAGMRKWLQIANDKPQLYRIVWESLFIDKNIFIEWYSKFFAIYEKNIINGQDAGTVKKIDSEVLTYISMGAANFLGLHIAILNTKEKEWDLDYIVDEYMKMFEKGVFAD